MQLDYHTITDERLYYSADTRLFRKHRLNTKVTHRWGLKGISVRKNDPEQVIEYAGIGFFGYYAGPQVHVVDHYGLGDALIARLPPYNRGKDWRPGHYTRIVPDGYVQTLKSKNDQNLISDKKLSEYYDHLKIITQGSTFSMERLLEIWKMNTGAYDHLIDFDTYRYPKSTKVNCGVSGCNKTGQPIKLG